MLLAIILLVGVLGFIPTHSISIRLSKQILAEFLIISFFFFFIKNIWLKLFCLWNVFSVIAHILKTNNYDKLTYISLMALFSYLVFYQIVYSQKFNAYTIINCIAIIALFQALFMLLHSFNLSLFFKPRFQDTMPVVGFLDNTNISGAFIAMTMPLFYRKKWCFWLPLMVYVLFKTNCLAAIISITIATIFYLWHIKKIFILPILAVALFYCLNFENPVKFTTHSVRAKTWINLVSHIIPKSPVFGIGLGQYRYLWRGIVKNKPEMAEYIQMPAHNEYVQTAIEAGLPALAFILMYILSLFYKFNKKSYIQLILFTSIISIAINSAGMFTFHLTLALIPITLLALYEKEADYGQRI